MAAKQQAPKAPNELDAETVAELKRKHGPRLFVIYDEDFGTIVFTPASKEAWGEFIDSNGSSVDDATRTLFDSCVVMPTGEELARLHEQFPALPDMLAVQIKEKSGGKRNLAPKSL